MTVNIVGSIAAADLPAAKTFVNTGDDDNRFHPLCNYGFSIWGLGDWTAETVQACGNLSERDYTVEDVAQTLRQMAAVVPSLQAKVHCGGDYESEDCVATITVTDGVVSVGPAEVGRLEGLAALGQARMAALVDGLDGADA
jgi:hypothetical protein